jgi:EAL domain-containing protein (putative c-di-GMP-specific phosphodiesterase class I)
VETAGDLETVTALGVRFVQGYHFAAPQPVGSLGATTPRNTKEIYT